MTTRTRGKAILVSFFVKGVAKHFISTAGSSVERTKCDIQITYLLRVAGIHEAKIPFITMLSIFQKLFTAYSLWQPMQSTSH